MLAALVFFVKKYIDKIELTKKANLITNLALAVLFVVITVVNIKLAKSIIFVSAWADPNNAQYSALRIVECKSINDGTWYYLLCSNNVPIAFFASLILKLYRSFENMRYASDFFFVEVNCVIIAVAGYFLCLTAKKITGKLSWTVLTFITYGALFALSPWKLIFYTDTAGMLMPIVTLYLYACIKKSFAPDEPVRYWALSLLCVSGMLGGLIKPTAYTVLIAIVIIEAIQLIFNKEKSKEAKKTETLAWVASLVIAFILINISFKGYIYQEAHYEPDKELEGTWTYYLCMGSNEEYMGTNNPVDSGLLVGEYTGRPGSERRAEELNRFVTRTKDRGVFGNLSFWNRKLTMTFNDGTFSWFREGIAAFWAGEYPEELSVNSHKEFLRNLFWGDGEYYPIYETWCQLIWIFVLIGLPGVAISLITEKEHKHELLLTVTLIGIILFQMLFETRARYLICSLPLIIVASVAGYSYYFDKFVIWKDSYIIRKKTKKTSEQKVEDN